MQRSLVIGTVAILTSGLCCAVPVCVADLRSPWTVVAMIPCIVLWIAGVVVIAVGDGQGDAANGDHACDFSALHPACPGEGNPRYQLHYSSFAQRACEAGLYRRAGTACAEPTLSPAEPARPATEVPMLPHATGLSPATVDRSAANLQAACDAYRDQILRHLIERYLTGDRLPSGTPNRFTVAEFHRLFRYVVQEGYGEQ